MMRTPRSGSVATWFRFIHTFYIIYIMRITDPGRSDAKAPVIHGGSHMSDPPWTSLTAVLSRVRKA